jgi:hypothetical protein
MSTLTGVDIEISNFDLSVSQSGDLKLVKDQALINQALYNRIMTPPEGYKRIIWVYKTNTLEVLDSEYGNKLYYYLSGDLAQSAISNLYELLKLEDRIKLKNVSLTSGNRLGEYNINIEYSLPDNTETYISTIQHGHR